MLLHGETGMYGSPPTSNSLKQQILTKGDNNHDDDTVLYPSGRGFVNRSEVVGVVKGYLPCLGWVTIAFSQWPWLKAMLLGLLATFAILGGS